MAETSGLLNRRTGYSRTEGSNPSVSAIPQRQGKCPRNRDCCLPGKLINFKHLAGRGPTGAEWTGAASRINAVARFRIPEE